MKIIYLLFILLISVPAVFSQTVTVYDKTTLQPLSNLGVFCSTSKISFATNSKGQADISQLTYCDSIQFRFIGYQTLVLSYKQLTAMKFRVYMSEKSYDLDEIVVSSSRFEEKRADVPQQIMVIKSREIEQLNQPTMAEVLQQSGNIHVQKSQMGGGSPVLRGFEANKVLLVVDGIRMNNAIYRSGHLQNIISIDNSILEKTEIVFGPGSVIYGSDALGGVIHLYTKKPELRQEGDSNIIKVNVFSRLASANNEVTGHLDFNLGFRKIAFLSSVTTSDFGDLRQGNLRDPFYNDWGKCLFYSGRVGGKDSMMINDDVNIQRRTGYKQIDYLQKILFRQSEHLSHVLNYQYSTSSNVPRYDRLSETDNYGILRNAEWYYGPQNRFLASYSLFINNKRKLYDEASVILSYQDISESRHTRRFGSDLLNNRYEKVKVYTFNTDIGKEISRHELRYGFEATWNQVNSTAEQKNIVTEEVKPLDTRYPDGGSDVHTGSAYFTHSWEISPAFILNDGIRFTNTSLSSKFIDTSFFRFPFTDVAQKSNSFNWKAGLTCILPGDFRITALAATGFRSPNVDDVSKVFESTQGKLIIPNPDLKPEQTYNAELSLSKVFDSRVKAELVAFYTLYKDVISTGYSELNGMDSVVYDGVISKVYTQLNKDKAFIYGLNAGMIADITNSFSIISTLNYTYGRIITDTVYYPLDHIPPIFGKTSFVLKIKKFRGEFYLLYNGARFSKDYNLLGEDNQIYSADPVNGYTPAWCTMNLKLSFQLNRFLQFQAAFENITDLNYRVFASGISSSGRNLIFTVRGKF